MATHVMKSEVGSQNKSSVKAIEQKQKAGKILRLAQILCLVVSEYNFSFPYFQRKNGNTMLGNF